MSCYALSLVSLRGWWGLQMYLTRSFKNSTSELLLPLFFFFFFFLSFFGFFFSGSPEVLGCGESLPLFGETLPVLDASSTVLGVGAALSLLMLLLLLLLLPLLLLPLLESSICNKKSVNTR